MEGHQITRSDVENKSDVLHESDQLTVHGVRANPRRITGLKVIAGENF